MHRWIGLFLILVLGIPVFADETAYTTHLTLEVDGIAQQTLWHPDGKHFWTWNETALFLHDAQTTDLIYQLDYDAGDERLFLRWSDDRTKAIAYGGSTLELWDVVAGESIWQSPVPIAPDFVNWNHAGDQISIRGFNIIGLAVYNADTGDEIMTLPVKYRLTDAAWSPDDSQILLVGNYPRPEGSDQMSAVQVLDVAAQEITLDYLTEGSLFEGDWGATGSHVAVAGRNAYLINVPDIAIRFERKITDGFQSISWNPDHTRAVVVDQSSELVIWNMDNGAQRESLTHPVEPPYSDWGLYAGWSSDGKYLASVSSNGIAIWDMDTQKLILEHTDSALQPFRSPDNSQLAVLMQNGDVAIYDLPSGELRQRLMAEANGLPAAKLSSARSITWNADQTRLLVWYNGLQYNPPHIWDIESGNLLAILNDSQFVDEHGLLMAQWTPDGSAVLVNSLYKIAQKNGTRIQLWQTP